MRTTASGNNLRSEPRFFLASRWLQRTCLGKETFATLAFLSTSWRSPLVWCLLVVAFQTILEQFRPVATDKTGAETLSFDSAVLRLTFPTIITPYGVAAVIILTAIASDTATKFVIFLIALGVLLLIYSPCSLHGRCSNGSEGRC